MKATIFKFSNNFVIRSIVKNDSPLFVAVDVCSALQYVNSRRAVSLHVDKDDLFFVGIDTNGGVQSLQCVNESGLYALIFGSKLEKAKEFKRWVTSEVLPSIRKTGSYTNGAVRGTALRPAKISNAQRALIRETVKRQAKLAGVYTQTIYEQMHNHFNMPSYYDFTVDQLDAVLAFIKTFTRKTSGGQSPATTLRTPSGYVVLEAQMAERLVQFAYYWHYAFRPELDMIYQLLRAVNSPKAARFYEVITGLRLPRLERVLEEQGYSVKSLPCYQALPASLRLG